MRPPVDRLESGGSRPGAPSGRFLLGTDAYGRSMVAVTIWGARISLTVGLLATLLAVGIGALVGVTAGHFGGWPGTVLMRVTDWFLVLPVLVLATALASVLKPGVGTVVVAIGVTSWPTTARVVRAQTLSVEARPYIERAKALGGGHWHVMRRHILPNVMPLMLAQATLTVSGAILAEGSAPSRPRRAGSRFRKPPSVPPRGGCSSSSGPAAGRRPVASAAMPGWPASIS